MGAVSLTASADLSRFLKRRADGAVQFDAMVKGARCAGCLAKIEKGVGALPGVAAARLNLSTGKLAVVGGAAFRPEAVLQRLHDLGYEGAPFEAGASLDEDAREGRFLLHCLVVAAFGTVFTMGLTDAIWYGGDMDAGLSRMFFWLAASVSIPATLYSGQPFFLSAWKVLKQGRTNMDVPISLALMLSLGLSVWQTAHGGRHVYFDAAVMLNLLLLAGRYLDFLLRNKARGAARHLLAMQSILVRRRSKDGALQTVAAADLNVGDHIFLASGERMPVDGVLEDHGTELDLSLVTGESVPVPREAGASVSAGSIITGAPVALRVTARVENSLVADLARLLEAGRQGKSLYVTLADRAARAYVPFVSVTALAVLAGWLWAGAGFTHALTNAVTVLIVTCPCALGLAVPAVQVAATGRLFRQGLFIKSGDALERLAEIDHAVFDKTGTLTLGVPVLENRNAIAPDVLERAARLARASSHPLARALALAVGEGPVAAGVKEVPGSGLELQAHGVSQRLGNAAWCGVKEEAGGACLWFAEGALPPVHFIFRDQIRPESREMLAALSARGLSIEMLTGDRAEPAERIAAGAGITRWHAGVGPKEKAARLTALAAQGRKVLMVGDGINDAAAMALAHVSIAPGTATDISQRTADMVLRGASLTPLVEALDVARKAKVLVVQNFILAALYNAAAIPLAALGLVTPLMAAAAMASSSLLVTLNALRLAPWRTP
jgi:Cu2+-exporting ATPase